MEGNLSQAAEILNALYGDKASVQYCRCMLPLPVTRHLGALETRLRK